MPYPSSAGLTERSSDSLKSWMVCVKPHLKWSLHYETEVPSSFELPDRPSGLPCPGPPRCT